jgi:cytochrome c oxidase assembly factor 5
MVDMRKRFRGNLPQSFRQIDQKEEEKGYQLYAGKPVFGIVKKTDGNEPEPKDWREAENEQYRKEQEQKKG